MDVTMPGMNGYEVTKTLKKNPETKHIPIIFVTTMVGEDNRAKGLDAGAADYIEKPFNIMELSKKIESLLSIRPI